MPAAHYYGIGPQLSSSNRRHTFSADQVRNLVTHEDRIWSFIGSAVVAVLAAFVAAFLATRRTKSETRWRAKYDAYARILSAIEDIRFWAEETYASNLLLPSIHGGQLDDAQRRYEEAKRVLWSFVHVGALVVCEDSRDQLDSLLTEIGREDFRFQEDATDDESFPQELADHCDKIRTIVGARLPKLMRAAKGDLR